MDKFWRCFCIKTLAYTDDYFTIPEQMLIGYMLEYIREHQNFDAVKERLDYVAAHSNIYDQLEEIIKDIDS